MPSPESLGFHNTDKVTPAKIEVSPGVYDVLFTKLRYKSKIIQNVTVAEGATVPVSATLEPSSNKGYLKVNTAPEQGALVTVDHTEGYTPAFLELTAGTYTVKITKVCYEPVTRTVTIAAGKIIDLGIIPLTLSCGGGGGRAPPGGGGRTPPGGGAPTEITKSEFLAELQKRGAIDISVLPAEPGSNKWYYERGVVHYTGSNYSIAIYALSSANPPTSVGFINFMSVHTLVDTLPKDWVLARLGELPFVGGGAPTAVTFQSTPSGATIKVNKV